MGEDYGRLKDNLVVIASELHRFKGVFAKAISKLDIDEQNKYSSQFQWFSKKVTKALDDAGIRVVTLDGQLYDPGMAVTPLNIEDFEADDILYSELSAVAGGEGLFNLGISGNGVLCLESECPKQELIEIVLQNDVLKIDGNMAIAWSGSLDFTVERSGKSLIGSAASGEGLVNVYRGTGKVLLAPVAHGLI